MKRKRENALYALTPLLRNGEVLEEAPVFTLRGSIDQYRIVSVPETTSAATVREMGKELQRILKKPVIVVTHNTEFLKVKRITGKEASKIMKGSDGNGST